MTLRIDGPDIGHRIGDIAVLTETGDRVTLAALPGETLIVIVFRGHW